MERDDERYESMEGRERDAVVSQNTRGDRETRTSLPARRVSHPTPRHPLHPRHPRCTIGCDTCDGTTNHVGHGNQRFLYKGMTQAELNKKNLTVDNPWNPKPGDMVLDPKSTNGLAAKSMCANPTTNATICASSLRTCNSQAECGSKDVRLPHLITLSILIHRPPEPCYPARACAHNPFSRPSTQCDAPRTIRTSEAILGPKRVASLTLSAPLLPRPSHYTGLLLLLPLACTGIGARHRRLRGRGGAPSRPGHRRSRRPVPEHDAGQAR